jgi:hypothetical protein
MIKFNQFAVTDGTTKARVHYSLDNRTDKRACVTIYARDYGHTLGSMFSDDTDYSNDTDFQTDYFDKGRVVLFEGHPLYTVARARVLAFQAKWDASHDASGRRGKAVA